MPLGYQKHGCEWNIILEALHEESFSHRQVSHIMAFYEQVSTSLNTLKLTFEPSILKMLPQCGMLSQA